MQEGKRLINKCKKNLFPSNNPVSKYAKRKEGGGTVRKVISEIMEDWMAQWARWPAAKNNNLDLSPESHTVERTNSCTHTYTHTQSHTLNK